MIMDDNDQDGSESERSINGQRRLAGMFNRTVIALVCQQGQEHVKRTTRGFHLG